MNPTPVLSTTVAYHLNNTKSCDSEVAATTLFERHDTEDNAGCADVEGCLNAEELSKMLYEMDYTLGTPDEHKVPGGRAEKVISLLDVDGDGLLDYGELQAADGRRGPGDPTGDPTGYHGAWSTATCSDIALTTQAECEEADETWSKCVLESWAESTATTTDAWIGDSTHCWRPPSDSPALFSFSRAYQVQWPWNVVNDTTRELQQTQVGDCVNRYDAVGVDNDFKQKECLITEMLGLPRLEPVANAVRCVRKDRKDIFGKTNAEYQCVPKDLCGPRPDPADSRPTPNNIDYNCDFSGCTPDALWYGDGSDSGEITLFRCWDSCVLAELPRPSAWSPTNKSAVPNATEEEQRSHLTYRNERDWTECEHIEHDKGFCMPGRPCIYVDTLDESVKNQLQADQKLANISSYIAAYARNCSDYAATGHTEECRWMRCHAMAYEPKLSSACDNVIPPPCRSVCEDYVRNEGNDTDTKSEGLGVCGLVNQTWECSCGDEKPVYWTRKDWPPRERTPEYWSYAHCRALRFQNCSAFPPDAEHETGGCLLPDRYPGGTPCVRHAECVSQACPLEHGDDSPAVEGEGGVCCNEGLNGCSGHGVCTLHSDSTTPRSLGPAAAVPFGGCVCDKEWTGSDCSQWMMPAHIFLAWLAVVSFLIFGTLSWCAVWLRWWLAIHRVTPPPPPDSPTKPPKKPAREESTSSDDSDSDEDLGNYACRLVVYVCNCTGLPTVFKGKMDTYVKVILGERAKRVRTIRNGGEEPKWTAGTEPDAGEEVGWYTTRRLCSIKVEVWRDEQRFKGVEGHDSVDRLLCRTVVPVPEFIPPEQTGKGVESDLWNIDGQEAGKVKLRLLWRDPGEPKRPVELDPV